MNGETKVCKHCGRPIDQSRGEYAVYCSPVCREKARYERRRPDMLEKYRLGAKNKVPLNPPAICIDCANVIPNARSRGRKRCDACAKRYQHYCYQLKKGPLAPLPTCTQCGVDLPKGKHKYCSEVCAAETKRKNTVKRLDAESRARKIIPSTFDALTPGARGAVSELIASAYFMAKGCHVFRSLSPHCPYDIVVEENGVLLRCEVKSAVRNLNGTLSPSSLKGISWSEIDLLALVAQDDEVQVKEKSEFKQMDTYSLRAA